MIYNAKHVNKNKMFEVCRELTHLKGVTYEIQKGYKSVKIYFDKHLSREERTKARIDLVRISWGYPFLFRSYGLDIFMSKSIMFSWKKDENRWYKQEERRNTPGYPEPEPEREPEYEPEPETEIETLHRRVNELEQLVLDKVINPRRI